MAITAPLNQRGIALVVVLWLVSLLALMAVSQSAAVRTETLVVGNLVESASARAAAYAGLQLAIADLDKPLAARDMASDRSVYTLRFDSAELFITIADENGKVDLNAAPAMLLGKLLKTGSVDFEQREALVDAILDWRDRDNLRRLNGAEEEEYRAAGLEYVPRNGPFQSLEELALVIGIDAELYRTIEENITIYSGNPFISMQAASPELQQALIDDGEEDIPTGHRDVGSALGNDPLERGAMHSGKVFSIVVEALHDSGVRERLQVVVRLHPSRGNAPLLYEVLRWREG